MASYLIVNGPNLNLLGTREPGIYGGLALMEYLPGLKALFKDHVIDHYQSNVEGELIDRLQAAEGEYAGVVLNAGGYTHTSVALRDAIAAISVPVVEVHISNLLSREEFRHDSLLAGVCAGSLMGFGLDGYRMALDHLVTSGRTR